MEDSKLNSRKFVVWLVWGVITALTVAIGVMTMIITKSFPQTVVELLTLVLGYFFYVSLVYLGVNGIQKVGFAVADALSNKEEGEK